MQDLTICPSCRIWKESLRVMPCCRYKFCDDCLWKTGGCVKCNNNLDFSLLRIYKPIDVLVRECLGSCKFCGEIHSTYMIQSHENSCPKTPLNDLVKEMIQEVPPGVSRENLTEVDLKEFQVQKNLLHSYNQMVTRYSSANSADGFITHVISDTDTLSGIALRYGVNVNDVRNANRLVGVGDQAIYKLMVIKVPINPSHVPEQGGLDLAAYNLLKRRMIARFARKSGCHSSDEAKYYLETHHFDFDTAMSEFSKDASVPLPTPPKTISTYVESARASHNKIKPQRTCCFSFA